MPPAMDPEYANEAGPVLAAMNAAPKFAVHDIDSRRKQAEGFRALFAGIPEHPDWAPKKFTTTTAASGKTVDMYWFANSASSNNTAGPGPAILHFHAGGYILGSVDLMQKVITNQAATADVPILSVDYRLAPESREFVEEGYAALLWLHAHAQELNVDPARIAVMGESAGGGLAAGVALYARDQKLNPPLKKQILVYPMLDDRNAVAKDGAQVTESPTWDYTDNLTAWTAVLGDRVGGDHDSYYLAPARAKDLAGLPSTYVDVGGLDIFLDEDLEFAQRLSAAGVYVEFHLHPGVPHGFEFLGPNSAVAKRAAADRLRACKSF